MAENKWKRLLSYYKPFKGILFADLFFAFLGAAVTLVIPLIVRYITSDIIYRENPLDMVWKLAFVMIGLVLIECYSNYFIAYHGHVMGAKIEYNMRNEIFSHYQKLSFSFYDNHKVGHLMSRISNDLFEITELLHHGPEDIIISIIKFVGSFVILININTTLTLLTFVCIPVIFVYAFVLNRKMKQAFRENRNKISDINSQVEDNLSGIRVVKSFANEDIEMDKFREGNGRFLSSKKNSYRYMGIYHSGLGAMISLVTVVVVTGGTMLLTNGTVAIADLIAFLLYINNFTEPVRKLINFTEQFQNGYSGFERFLEIMNVEPDIKDKEDAVSVNRLEGNIDFNQVDFKYEETTKPVLQNVNLHINKGEYIALVGSSGAGKTTVCSLIPRFYEVSSGSVCIDGTDIRDMKLHDLRSNIGIVQQDVYLFVGTIMDNIRYGKPDATEEEIIAAAKEANAHDFIMELPDGYDTDIGQRGVKLSGGQKQRISIARVFLKNPPILIFDEATSALDNESEKIVQQSLEKLAKNRTTLVIAHRLSTIRNAERILVLSEKGVEEEGSHEELLKKEGAYASLYKMQFS